MSTLAGRPGRRPRIMGVINVTPDSFSDGGRFAEVEAAVAHGHALVAAGADLLDVGGESTRPGAAAVGADEEAARVVPVISRLARELPVAVSVDTVKAAVARAAVEAGARLVNDVSGGLADPAMLGVVEELGVGYVIGYLPPGLTSLAQVHAAAGAPPRWTEVADGLAVRLAALSPVARARAWVDPGLGFAPGADPAANLALVRHAGDLGRALGCPVLVGPSRKRFLRQLLDRARAATPAGAGVVDELSLDAATVGACLLAAAAGADVVRVHNVALLHAALTVYTGE